ncbi:MAG: flavin reductase [Treponemataceae bacterium]
MSIAIEKAANLACVSFTSLLVILVGSKGLGFIYPPVLEFWVLQVMHLSFFVAFGMGFFQAVRTQAFADTIVYGVPMVAFLAALASAVFSVRIPAPLFLVFDLYLIVVSVRFLVTAPRFPAAPHVDDYHEVPAAESYALLNTGGLVLVCTKGTDGRYDLAPIAWSCPLDYEPSSRVMIVLDPGHRTSENIEASLSFVLALPTFAQRKLVELTGSISGRDTDKYEKFAIASSPTVFADARVPEGVAGYLECKLIESRRIGSVAVIAAEVVRAVAVSDAWRYRLHYAGEKAFYRPGTTIRES